MFSSVKERDMKALADYQDLLMRNPKLRFIFFELTDKCNLQCLHCGSSCDSKKNMFLTLDAVKSTLESIAREYDPCEIMVCLTGGEPMLHPALPEIIALARGMGFPVGITTNGTLIDDANAKKLSKSGLNTVAVSIDGTKVVHDRFRCSSGSFDKAMNGIMALKLNGIEPQVMTVASKANLHDLPALGEYLQSKEIYSWRITNIDPIGRAQLNSNLLLSKDEILDLLSFIRNLRYSQEVDMEVTYGCSHFLTYDFEREVRDFYFQCGAGILVGSVMANGDIGACLDIERRSNLIQGNIYKDDFMTIWNNRFEIFRINRAAKSHHCGACAYKDVCRGDSAHTWDYDLDEPRYCFAGGEKLLC